jgi:hypothetical protein
MQGASSSSTEGIDVEARQLQVDAHWAADTASRSAMAITGGGAHSDTATTATVIEVIFFVDYYCVQVQRKVLLIAVVLVHTAQYF